ncbi:glycosyltransferase [Paramagnetospirillum kuznetsovii]|nr:glycosyltransferase [Paramagnetospirillum kuznetsovii]
MTENQAGKTCCVVMATYDDWQSVAYIIPFIDKILAERGLVGHVVIVDDSSRQTDGRAEVAALSLRAIRTVDEVQLGSNQGNQRATAVGLGYVARNIPCDFLVVMDSDNEDKPEDIADMLEAAQAGDCRQIIFADRTKRSESRSFKAFYYLYKKLFKLLIGRTISMGNFCLIPGKLVKRIAHIAELWNHFPASIMRAGLPFATVPTERGRRVFGKGKMNLVRLIIHAFSGFTIHADVMAVRIMLLSGLLMAVFSVMFVAASVIRAFDILDFIPVGWMSQMLMGMFLLVALVASTAVILLITILSLRLHLPMTPFHDHGRFIFGVTRHYGDGLPPMHDW